MLISTCACCSLPHHCCNAQGRQPGWLFDDADAAEAAGNADFFQQGGDLYGSMYGTPRAQHTAPHGPYSTPAGPGRSSSTLYSAGAAGTAAANMLPQAGPWDELRIIHKLLRCIGPELSACEHHDRALKGSIQAQVLCMPRARRLLLDPVSTTAHYTPASNLRPNSLWHRQQLCHIAR